MTHYLQEELNAFWGRLTPYLTLLESTPAEASQDKAGQEPGAALDPIGRVTVDTEERQAFALHTTDVKPRGDTSDTPTGHSATYTRFKASADAAWGPWHREAY
ncbi:hypothetical protein [Paraburkholderia sp. DHOC27]|uniref:hypothetical protein n=1 Tax=Paraburkholderia sp. DHOC27 TaxID=2303330 RepID=UPI000E3DBF55|nr:hypothetical protein [Paraburkholderia sp. DHOC27]RFU45114.1 hypothetical protein D0B32_25600 [Paraburkholderia sp. DHOC27]